MLQLNDITKENKVVMDAILPEGIKQYYRTVLGENERLARSIEGRSTTVHLVPDKLLSFSTDLLVARDIALLANWDEETLVLVKNPDMVALLRSLYETLREVGMIFDHSAYVRSVIAGSA